MEAAKLTMERCGLWAGDAGTPRNGEGKVDPQKVGTVAKLPYELSGQIVDLDLIRNAVSSLISGLPSSIDSTKESLAQKVIQVAGLAAQKKVQGWAPDLIRNAALTATAIGCLPVGDRVRFVGHFA